MRHRAVTLAAIGGLLAACPAAAAPDQVLFSFQGTGAQGSAPLATVLPLQGRLYGTTQLGGTAGAGTIYVLTPPAGGQTAWTETTLFSFTGPEGSQPLSSLVADANGNLFGTASLGGDTDGGTVFELSPPAGGGGPWRIAVLHSFTGAVDNVDGFMPGAGLTFGAGGVLYGTTQAGGRNGVGTIFSLTPPAAGQGPWAYAVVHDFREFDGDNPDCVLATDATGALYGTTAAGGDAQGGVVFTFVPPAAGRNGVLTVLYQFQFEADGGAPFAGVVRDGSGALYGTTTQGGAFGAGTVWKLAPAGGAWAESVLYDFRGRQDGGFPQSALLLGPQGQLFGTAISGISLRDGGSAFALLPPEGGEGAWRFHLLHHFTGSPDGKFPASALVQTGPRRLVTTTVEGGAANAGTVLSIEP